MELTVIASSSEGNAYVIQNEGEALIIEAGAPFVEILKAVGHNVKKINGCLISHEHGDHAGHINEVLSYGLPVYASLGTISALTSSLKSGFKPTQIGRDSNDNYNPFQAGRFEIYPFRTKHDSQEPLGFYIWHPETGGILFATDTAYLKNTFGGLRQILIECNYHPETLARNVETGRGKMTWERAQRVKATHLSVETCLGALKANDLSQVNNIVLIHVSHTNGNAPSFKQTIERATGRPTFIAKPGLTLNFNKEPF